MCGRAKFKVRCVCLQVACLLLCSRMFPCRFLSPCPPGLAPVERWAGSVPKQHTWRARGLAGGWGIFPAAERSRPCPAGPGKLVCIACLEPGGSWHRSPSLVLTSPQKCSLGGVEAREGHLVKVCARATLPTRGLPVTAGICLTWRVHLAEAVVGWGAGCGTCGG